MNEREQRKPVCTQQSRMKWHTVRFWLVIVQLVTQAGPQNILYPLRLDTGKTHIYFSLFTVIMKMVS